MNSGGINRNSRKGKIGNMGIFMISLILTVSLGCAALLISWVFWGGTGLKLAAVSVEAEVVSALSSVSGPQEVQTLPEPGGGKYDALLQDPQLMQEGNIYTVTPAAADGVTLAFAGDILFDDGYSIMAKMKSRSRSQGKTKIPDIEVSFSPQLLNEMRAADIFMLNNEFTYSGRGTPTEGKTYTFRANPDYAPLLQDIGVDIVSLANNHSYDYGEISLTDTLDTLKGINMPYVGAGRNLDEAVRPVYYIAGDLKIAFLSATQIERVDNPDTKGATAASPGVFRCREVDGLVDAVAKAKAESDFVVVYIHWGTESTSELDWAQKEQAPKIAAAGADLIIGDHPHVLQGISWYGNTPVIFSLGNYLFNSKTMDTCLIKVNADESGIKFFQFLPAQQKDCYTGLLEGSEKQRVINYMRSLSPDVTIDDEGYVTPRSGNGS